MNRDEFIDTISKSGFTPIVISCLIKAFDTGAAVEREECAKVCEEKIQQWRIDDGGCGDHRLNGMMDGAEFCADAIRARGQG